MTTQVVIAGYARTPFARLGGALANVPASELGAHAIRHALSRAAVEPASVDRVVAGHVLQAAAGQNPARQAAVTAGIPLATPAVTINAVCLSGLEAIADAARLIRAGEADIVVAVGMESMSRAPHATRQARLGQRYGALELVDTVEHDGLTDAFERRSMGAATEDGNARFGLDRVRQDDWAASSHRRAAQARALLGEEIVPIDVTVGRATTTITTDDGVRDDTTSDALARLRPAFSAAGTITAGNASQLTDGAAALVLMRSDVASSGGHPVLATIAAHALVSGPDLSLHLQPAAAIRDALQRTRASSDALAVVEINEAFASVALASTDDLGIEPSIVNPLGGAIALGHPIGASGARIVGSLALQLRRTGRAGALGAAGICGGGGQGSALILRA